MKWVIVDTSQNETIYGRVDDDGLMRVTCIAEHPEFAAWILEGNTPEIL
jgi:hypothetical protein